MISFVAGTRVHVVAIGGAGMSAIARALMQQGCIVSGSDAQDSTRLQQLRQEGADAYVGHDSQELTQRRPDVVIHSTAVKPDNPELAAARALGVPVMARTDAIKELLAGRHVIEVIGTHGKTTTASMLVMAAVHVGQDPSYLVGSEIAQTGTNAAWAGPLTIFEGDESDGSGFHLSPSIVIVTNVDMDHMDVWKSPEELQSAFEKFVCKVPDGGAVIACADDPGAVKAAAAARAAGKTVVTYGSSETADVRMVESGFGTRGPIVRIEGLAGPGSSSGSASEPASLHLRVPGLHNLRNASAVVAVARHLQWPMPQVLDALQEFRSTRRRFETIGVVEGIEVVDDYAHHPAAVAATIDAAQRIAQSSRASGPTRRVVVVCQPYRWYRTAAFVQEYASALASADSVVLLDVYGPGEEPIAGAGPEAIVSLMGPQARYIESKAAAVEWLASTSAAGDLVLTLGGEDVRTVAHSLVEELERRSNRAHHWSRSVDLPESR